MIKILVVEDEEPISNLIRMNLVKAGYQCECSFDGLDAADMIWYFWISCCQRLMDMNYWSMPRP